jgi:hypothetical protein
MRASPDISFFNSPAAVSKLAERRLREDQRRQSFAIYRKQAV